MKNKTIITLGIVFFIMFVVAAVQLYLKSAPTKESLEALEGLKLSSITKSEASSIVIVSGVGQTFIEKRGEGWTVNGKDASSSEIDRFFKVVKAVRIESVVSKNERAHAGFGATATLGYVLTVNLSDESLVYIVGKQGPIYDSFYIKRFGATELYVASGKLRGELTKALSTWQGVEVE